MYAHEARERGIEVRTYRASLADIDRARLDDAEDGFLDVCVKKGSDEISVRRWLARTRARRYRS
jgi:pyruvate/2-oxoglutarate dehydrogenase complex dihydrolipoamide dehydrogenase (E3) component